jgi:hypothetical protein
LESTGCRVKVGRSGSRPGVWMGRTAREPLKDAEDRASHDACLDPGRASCDTEFNENDAGAEHWLPMFGEVATGERVLWEAVAPCGSSVIVDQPSDLSRSGATRGHNLGEPHDDVRSPNSRAAASYSRSSLSKYLEEALAETAAQVGVNGLRAGFRGVSFPVQFGYVTLLREVTVGYRTVRPFLPELGGLTAGGFVFGGVAYEVWWTPSPPKPADVPQ